MEELDDPYYEDWLDEMMPDEAEIDQILDNMWRDERDEQQET